jgi:hypothetical protein
VFRKVFVFLAVFILTSSYCFAQRTPAAVAADLHSLANEVAAFKIVIPNVVGLVQPEATTTVAAAGFSLGSISTDSSPTVAAGIVLSQSPAPGTLALSNTPVALVVSSGLPQMADTASLQAAINAGQSVRLVPGQTYGPIVLRSNAHIDGAGATIAATSATVHALVVPPGTINASIAHVTMTALASSDSVARCGENTSTTQSQIAQVPTGIVFEDLTIPSHRGKHGIEWHCNGDLLNNHVLDMWNTTGIENHALWIHNTTGHTRVLGGKYEGSAQNLLIGGDSMKLVDADGKQVVPVDILFEGVDFTKPDSWRPLVQGGDGINRGVKNNFEMKNGSRVTVRNCIFGGSWIAAQDGPSFLVTPKNGGDIHDVLVENNTFVGVGYAFSILGQSYVLGVNGAPGQPTPSPVSGLVIRNNKITTLKYTSRGVLAVITGSPHDVSFIDNIVTTDGSSFLIIDPGVVLSADGMTQVPAGPMAALTMTGNYLVNGNYGLIFKNATTSVPPDTATYVTALNFSSNSIAAADSWMKTYFPSNTYIDRLTWNGLVAGF